ncbi:aspartate kinase [Halobacillus sp. ACCC02827]|uniref:aspartate kinase n=1 Tax=Halobacillus sp. ACCC02827 TaxID=3052090 RepID=UPI00256FFF01|nr:aspartate kinase [Halobacillus sp. ACCC02827]WJE17130.1 aspartate kinase [Halobacillus sp. ACCC02827]
MAIIVQKFGGTSLQSTERIAAIRDRILLEREKGSQLVVVVSAMGDSTNRLLSLAKELTNRPDPRDMDLLLATGEQVSCSLLSLALKEKGVDAVALTGPQAGIQTEHAYGKARITKIATRPIQEQLDAWKIVVVAGFQGTAGEEEICTLGRGGSDTTAAALAAELGAERCDIFTDVDGVYSADPRSVRGAIKYSCMDYDCLLAMAAAGASVIHPRAVLHARSHDVPLHVRSSFHTDQGTRIERLAPGLTAPGVTGITGQKGLTLLRMTGDIDLRKLRETLAEAHVTWSGIAAAKRDAYAIIMKEEEIYETMNRINRKKETLGIHTVTQEPGKALVHLVCGSEDQKKKQANLIRTSPLFQAKEAETADCHPEAWSAVLPEKNLDAWMQQLHDRFLLKQDNQHPVAYG